METMDQRAPCARADGLVVQELAGELLVYDLERHRAHGLNPSAALIWRHCDGQRSVADLAALLPRELSLPADEEVVWLALDRLDRAHLLRERLVGPEERTKYSRRALMRKLGLAGGLAMLLPLVDSITSPAAAQTQSCFVGCSGLPDCSVCRAGSGPGSSNNCNKRCVNGICVNAGVTTCP